MVALNYQKKHIRKNDNSRPGYKLLRVQATIVHYTANPGADADDHFRYFDQTIVGSERYAGAQIVVDRHKALELIPLDEGTFGANDGGTAALKLQTLRARDARYPTRTGDGNANLLTIHIEMCQEPDGSIHPHTIERTRQIIKMLQDMFPQLKDTKNRVVRHFDVTGKNCPRPFVEDIQKWRAFLSSIDQPVYKKESSPKPVAKPKVESKPSYVGKRAESIYKGSEGLDFYSKPTFNDKYRAGVLHYQYGFPKIVRKLKVEGAYMYEVKNSRGATYYVTASPKYIKVE
jgi:N-acetylmuramoyl-L-alanine amidase